MKEKIFRSTKKAINLFLAVLTLSGASQIFSIKASAQSWVDENQYDIGWYSKKPNATSYEISDARELAGLAYLVNTGKTDFDGKEIKLTTSIDLSESNNTWEPIGLGIIGFWENGTGELYKDSKPFKGTFNGKNKTIKGIKTDDNKPVSGLFGANEGTIKNVGVIESEIKGTLCVGGIAGWNGLGGKIENSYNTGEVSSNSKSDSYAGGVVGFNREKIENSFNKGAITSFNTGKITGSGNDHNCAGGVSGHNCQGKISNSCNQGSVSNHGDGHGESGGIVGSNSGGISSCCNKESVISNSNKMNQAGGISGCNIGNIECSYNINVVKSNCDGDNHSYAGGVASYNLGNIELSYNTGPVSSNCDGSGDSYAGGIVGYNNSRTIQNIYNTGPVSSICVGDGNSYAGGVIGLNYFEEGIEGEKISNSYNTGPVKSNCDGSGNSYAGGVVGSANEATIIQNSYYNNESKIEGTIINYNGEEKTIAEMKALEFAEKLGKAFINPNPLKLNKGFPVLKCFEERNISNAKFENYNKSLGKFLIYTKHCKSSPYTNSVIRLEDLGNAQ